MIIFQKENFIDSKTLFPKVRELKFFDKIVNLSAFIDNSSVFVKNNTPEHPTISPKSKFLQISSYIPFGNKSFFK